MPLAFLKCQYCNDLLTGTVRVLRVHAGCLHKSQILKLETATLYLQELGELCAFRLAVFIMSQILKLQYRNA